MDEKKKTKKEEKAMKDEVVLRAKLGRWWSELQANRKNQDWQWFKYDLWVRGLHNAKYDRNTQQIITTPKPSGRVDISINKIYTTLRGVRNYVLRNRPKAETTPYNLTPENVNEAVKVNMYLDYMHDKLKLRTKLRGTMWQALKYSVGYWQVLWDEDAEDGKGDIVVNQVDPYDLYFDGLTIEDSQKVVLAVKRPIAKLKEDPLYKDFDWDTIKTDGKYDCYSTKEVNLNPIPRRVRVQSYSESTGTRMKSRMTSGSVLWSMTSWLESLRIPSLTGSHSSRFQVILIL